MSQAKPQDSQQQQEKAQGKQQKNKQSKGKAGEEQKQEGEKAAKEKQPAQPKPAKEFVPACFKEASDNPEITKAREELLSAYLANKVETIEAAVLKA